MDATPHGLFVRQSKQISVLAQIVARAVADLSDAKASAYEVQREADALSLSKGLEVAGAAPPLPPTERLQSAGPRGGAGCTSNASATGTVRVGDLRQDLDALCAQMRRARADLDAFGCTTRRQDEVIQQSALEMRRLRSDLQDMQEALVTHDNDIQDLTVVSKAASKKIDVETEAWRAATVRDAAELRQMLKSINDDVDGEFRRLQQALDTGLCEDRKLISKFSAELRADISTMSGASGQETKDWVKEFGAEQEKRLASVDARVQDLLTNGLSCYGEGLRIEMRELRGRVEAEFTSCRQEQSLLSQRLSNNLVAVEHTSRRTVEDIAELQKAIAQLNTDMGVVHRGVENVRQTTTDATESLRSQVKENQEASNHSSSQIEQQAETMANIITRVVSEARAEFETTVSTFGVRLDESSAEQLASSQRLSSAQEELERQMRDAVEQIEKQLPRVVGQHAAEANSRLTIRLNDLEGRNVTEMEELRGIITSQRAKFETLTSQIEKATQEARSAHKGHSEVATEKLREDVGHWLTELRVALSDVQRELSSSLRGLEHELASSRKAQDAKAAQLGEDLNDVRRRFDGPEGDEVARAKEIAERVENAARQSATEIAATVKSMREQIRTDHDELGVELRGLLAHSEQRLRLGIDGLQSRVDEVKVEGRRTQSEASADLQKLQGGLSQAERILNTLQSSVHDIELNVENVARASNGVSPMEVKAQHEELWQLRNAADIISTAMLRISQVIGVLPGLNYGDDLRNGGDLNVTELLRWEHEGNSLVKRIESATRSLAQGGSMLEVLNKKAEQSTLRLVQSALRDLDMRLTHMRTGGVAEALGSSPERKSLFAETQDQLPHTLIPRPPSAPPPSFARRVEPISGQPLGLDALGSIQQQPPPAW